MQTMTLAQQRQLIERRLNADRRKAQHEYFQKIINYDRRIQELSS